MNCHECKETDEVKKNTGLALDLLRQTPLSAEDRDRAIKCRECAADKMTALLKERLL